jgi:hypothetical protein
MANPEASLEELSQAAATCGVEISAQGLDARFTLAGAACLKMVLETSLSYVLESKASRGDILDRFQGVYLQDSTVIALPSSLVTDWPGCGNQNGAGAGLKLQTMLEYQGGRLTFSLHPAIRNDCPLQSLDLPAGALRLADMGYFDIARLEQLTIAGVFWLTRLPAKVRILDEEGRKTSLSSWLESHALEGHFDGCVKLTAKGWPVRLLAQQVSPDVAARRQQQALAEAKSKGYVASFEGLALCHWSLCITNLNPHQLSLDEALVLLRLRWQIELLFKLWKSQASLTSWRSAHPERILCEVFAKLLMVVVQHWLLLIGCWNAPDRSLVKAAQTIRKHAFHLVGVLHDPLRLATALQTICRSIARCRVNKRKARPATFQRLASLADP